MIKEKITQEGDFNFDDAETKMKKDGTYDKLSTLFEDLKVAVPRKGQVVRVEYQGMYSDQFVFASDYMKDDIRIENKPYEMKYLDSVMKGDLVDVLIVDIELPNFLIKGSISQLYEEQVHQDLKSDETDEPVLIKVKSTNPAGYDVDIIESGVTLAGFMPNTLAGVNKLHDPESIVGETIDAMVESYSESEGTYIVSRKRYLQTLIPEAIESIKYDEVYTGTVTGTAPFGVFVEFEGCLTGMVHKDNLNREWRDKISDIKPGFQIDFYVKEIVKDKRGKNKIILTQMLEETVWDTIEEGDVFDGTVTTLQSFGALVNLDDNTVGLVHTSNLRKYRGDLKEGDEVEVEVLTVDKEGKKISLAINQ